MCKKIMLGILVVMVLLIIAEMSLSQPPGGPGGMRGGRGGGRGMMGSTMSNPVLANSPAEKKILDVLEDMRINQSAGMMNVPAEDGRLLRLFALAINAKKVVEIGASNGYSGIWIALALRQTGGKLITHDIDEGRTALALQNYKRAGVDNIITHVFGDAHQTIAKIEGPVDMVFIDADKPGYMDYLTKMLPKVRDGGLIVAHNVDNTGSQMGDYLKAITTDPSLETVFMGSGQGLGVTLKKPPAQ